jgi:hypothetical protein
MYVCSSKQNLNRIAIRRWFMLSSVSHVDMPVYNGGNFNTLAVMPQNLVHGFRLYSWLPLQSFNMEKG